MFLNFCFNRDVKCLNFYIFVCLTVLKKTLEIKGISTTSVKSYDSCVLLKTGSPNQGLGFSVVRGVDTGD